MKFNIESVIEHPVGVELRARLQDGRLAIVQAKEGEDFISVVKAYMDGPLAAADAATNDR